MDFTPNIQNAFEIAGKNTRVFNKVATDHWGTGELVAVKSPSGGVRKFSCICLPQNRTNGHNIGTPHEYPRLEITFRPSSNPNEVEYAVHSVKLDNEPSVPGGSRNVFAETRLTGKTTIETPQDACSLTESVADFADHLLWCKKIADDIDGNAWI